MYLSFFILSGTRSDTINRCGSMSTYSQNMRLDGASQDFSNTLLQLGSGALKNDNGRVNIHEIGIPVDSQDALIQ
jgi:hypothetical protein